MAFDQQLGDDVTPPGDLTPIGDASVPRSGRRAAQRGEVEVGDTLGDYAIERRLGAGGMGEVFAARGPAGELVALKVLATAGSRALYRFKREFRALADVRHPNLITLHALVVPAAGVPFFTMELIDGVPFSEYVRGRTARGRLPNLMRLGRALAQLVVGLHHLHLAGYLHRDVKPSNVLVTRAGRVVILDFGLVSERASDDTRLTHDGVNPLGTPAYMSPEQALSHQASAASDHYAVGVMLYECLTGELPFKGSAIEVMLHKQEGDIPDPRAVVAAVPDELRSLCMRLLAREQHERPEGPAVLETLDELELTHSASGSGSDSGAGRSGSFAGTSMSSSALRSSEARLGVRAPFIGRKAELAELTTALRDVEETKVATTVHVHGPSGLGKSALIARFLARAKRKHEVLVLSGRCYERESVPYKGVDAIIDELSLHLRALPAVELAALQPRALGPLTQIFPVLGDVWAPPKTPGPGDAAELRRLGLAALRELVVRLASRRPLLLTIDDFQWADLDSVRLLQALVRPPAAPAMLTVLSFREDLELRPAAREVLAELRDNAALAGQDVRALGLGPLAEADARDLTLTLMGDAADPELAAGLVERAGANPFAIAQLVRGLVLGGDATAELSVDELVTRRIVELEPLARRLVAIVAVAGGPVAPAVLVELLELEPGASLTALIDELCGQALVVRTRGPAHVTTGASEAGELAGRPIEAAHGRISELVLAELDPEELRSLHAGLAEVLERQGADLETIAEHFFLAGDAERAVDYSARAAESAAAALAFARAVELYERTLELLPAKTPAARRHALRLALAEQLTNTGHGARAADILLELAVVSPVEDAWALRRRAAVQLLSAGRLDEGLDLSATLLRELGERLPRGFWSAVWMIVRERARLWLRGRRGRPALREAEAVPAQLLTRVDLLASVTTGLWLQEVIVSQALHSRALVLAREAGEPRRLGMMLSLEFVTLAARGRVEQARGVMVECRELAARVDEPELDRAIDLATAMIEWFAPRMAAARVKLGALLRRLESAPQADWIRAYGAIRYAEACMYQGRLAELRRELPGWIATARDHGNLHELASLCGIRATISLYYDDIGEARSSLEAGREVWASSRYTIPDLTLDLSAVNVEIYAARFAEAERVLDIALTSLRDAGLTRIPLLRTMLDVSRARWVARALLHDRDNVALARELDRACKRQREGASTLDRGEVWIHDATLHSLRGETDAVRRCLRLAENVFDEHGQRGLLAAVQLRLADLTRGRESADYEARALAYLSEEGVSNRRRFVEWLVPLAPSR